MGFEWYKLDTGKTLWRIQRKQGDCVGERVGCSGLAREPLCVVVEFHETGGSSGEILDVQKNVRAQPGETIHRLRLADGQDLYVPTRACRSTLQPYTSSIVLH